jgi:oxygen-independent coproporphyrinogen-3 oxidase
MDETAIYIHWPFCRSKCPYCGFASIGRKNGGLYERFGNYLLLDLKNSIAEISPRTIKSVFFGGGTPSLMYPASIEKILNFLSQNYALKNNAEITLEANPGTFDLNRAEDFKNAGINRLSLGVQSFADKNLKFLGRIYGGKQVVEATEIVSKVFKNFSFDFIYGYECQKLKDLERDLVRAMDFDCKHISCYQLTFEEGTPFYDRMLSGDIKKISENKEMEFYNLIESLLAGYTHYEISNYSILGFESQHNLAYWRYDDYLGIGPSAHSRITIDGEKYEKEKIADPFFWETALNQNRDTFSHSKVLTENEKLEEAVIMGLRLASGITMDDLYREVSPEVVNEIISERKLKFLREKKLMTNEKIQLSKIGFQKADSVIEFLLGERRC